jgi:hypothetical protein
VSAVGYVGNPPGSGGEGGSVAWADITGKPTTFTPATHAHAQADVTGLTAALAAKADSSHTHTIANVTGLQTALDAKAATTVTDALDSRLDDLEAMTPVLMVWDGSAYVESTTARVYVGPSEPTGTIPDGSVWIDSTP